MADETKKLKEDLLKLQKGIARLEMQLRSTTIKAQRAVNTTRQQGLEIEKLKRILNQRRD